MRNMKTQELVSIASAGGGMRLKATMRTTTDLVSIAAAASKHQATLIITDVDMRRTDELVSIASAGKGCVMFEF